MNQLCRVSQDELNHDHASFSRQAYAQTQASQDLARVVEVAENILLGGMLKTSRYENKKIFDYTIQTLVPIKTDMSDVSVAVFDDNDKFVELLKDIAAMKAGAAMALADLTRKHALQVVFYALDMDDEYGDLDSLVSEAA